MLWLVGYQFELVRPFGRAREATGLQILHSPAAVNLHRSFSNPHIASNRLAEAASGDLLIIPRGTIAREVEVNGLDSADVAVVANLLAKVKEPLQHSSDSRETVLIVGPLQLDLLTRGGSARYEEISCQSGQQDRDHETLGIDTERWFSAEN